MVVLIVDPNRDLAFATANIEITGLVGTIPGSPPVKVAGQSGFLGQCYIGSTVLVQTWSAGAVPPPPAPRRSVAYIGV